MTGNVDRLMLPKIFVMVSPRRVKEERCYVITQCCIGQSRGECRSDTLTRCTDEASCCHTSTTELSTFASQTIDSLVSLHILATEAASSQDSPWHHLQSQSLPRGRTFLV